MGVAARRRVTKRVPYERLRERLVESALPWDDEAERLAIGAVLLAPNGHAKRLSRRAYSGHFYDRGHGWLWEELGLALVRCRLDLDSAERLKRWLEKAEVLKRFKERFTGSGGAEMRACIDSAFWWHGDWYVDRVLAAAKVRSRIMTAADHLREALAAGDEWRAGR